MTEPTNTHNSCAAIIRSSGVREALLIDMRHVCGFDGESDAQFVERFAAMIIKDIAFDMFDNPDLFAGITCFEELHDICDANAYVIAVEERLGIDFLEVEEWYGKVNQAVEIVDAWLKAVAR